ncbi:hypothetical protein EDB87DRAFT_1579594 [Lactarius vividus]|nr:hypothetical protein EDB87DRAFT_1579594 [Lactarius vividus]
MPLLTALQLSSSSALRGKSLIRSTLEETEPRSSTVCGLRPNVTHVRDSNNLKKGYVDETVSNLSNLTDLKLTVSVLDSDLFPGVPSSVKRLPPAPTANISIRAIPYGLPRVGDQDWANFVDVHLS